MTYRTAEESLEKYKKSMGDELGTVFFWILQETYYVSSLWNQYETLFERSERITLLNDSGGNFFGNVQRVFFEYVLLGIGRLTDPLKTGKKENLTILQLPELVEDDIKPSLSNLVEKAVEASTFCRDWRNRKIAHNDLAYRRVGSPLEAVTRDSVTSSLIAIHDVLRIPSMKYCESHLEFVALDDNAVTELLFRLHFGQRHMGDMRERAIRGEYSEEDVGVPDWLNQSDPLLRYNKR